MYFIFDTETTGLPMKKGWSFDDPKNTTSYDTARLVSISWIVCNDVGTISKEAYHVVRPQDFIVPEASTAIHGITQEQAEKDGKILQDVLSQMKEDMKDCTTLVAHNISFDTSIILSEAYRANDPDLVTSILSKDKVCTMLKGQSIMKTQRYPKLEALYEFFYKEPIVHAHHAKYDTLHCYKCLLKVMEEERGSEETLSSAKRPFIVNVSADEKPKKRYQSRKKTVGVTV